MSRGSRDLLSYQLQADLITAPVRVRRTIAGEVSEAGREAWSVTSLWVYT